MPDIAQIGFAADTSGLTKADAALENVEQQAKKTEGAVMSLSGSFSFVNSNANALQKAAAGIATQASNTNKVIQGTNDNLKRQTTAMSAAQKETDAWFRQLNKAKTAASGMSFEAKNLSYQLVDVTQGLASGQPVFQIFAQQAGQIGQVIATAPGGLGGLMKELGKSIAGILTPMRLAALGIGGLAAGFAVSAVSIINSIKAFDDLARSIDQTAPKLRGLQTTAAFKGINSDDFAAGMKSFAASVYDAQRNMGSLNGLMIANNKQAKTFDDYFNNIADLVAKTTSNVQKQKILEAAGLPTTQEWVRYMSQGSAAIRAAASGTTAFNDAAEQNLIKKAREFDDAWNTATTKMVQYFKAGIVEIVAAMSGVQVPDWLKNLTSGAIKGAAGGPLGALVGAAKGAINPASTSFNDRFGSFAPTGANLADGLQKKAAAAQGPQPKTQAELLEENRQMQSRLSILGEMATVEQQVKQKQLELNAAALQGVGVNDEMGKKIINATRAQAEMTRVQQQAQIGIFNLSAAQKAAADTLQSWIDKGLVNKNNAEQMAAAQEVLKRNIEQMSNAAQVAAAPLQQLKQLQLDASNFGKQLDTTLTNSLNNLVTPIQDVLNGVTSLKDGFKNAGIIILKAIQEMVIKMLILAPIAKGLQSIFGGFGGVNPLAGAFSFGKNANGNAFNDNGIAKFALGGMFTNGIFNKPTMFGYGGKFGMMGEAGPEAVMPLKRGPNGSLGVQMYGQSSNDNSSVAIGYSPTYNLGGSASQEDLANLRKEQAKDRREFASKVAESLQGFRKRNVRV